MKDIFSKMMNPPVEEEVVTEDIITAEPLIGVVKNCFRLNIRKEPNITADVVTESNEGAVLMIEPSESTDEWFKVYTEAGIAGYCMKKYVEYSE